MAWLGASLLAVGFIALIFLLRLAQRAQQVTAEAKASLAVIRNKELDDLQKEKQLQRHSLRLFGHFFFLTFGGVLALGLPAALVWGMSRLGWFDYEAVLATVVSWQFILASTLVGIVLAVVVRSMKRDV